MNNINIKITTPFWLNYFKLIKNEMLPYQWAVLNDTADIVIEKERDAAYIPSQKSHAIENFKIAAGLKTGHHYGMVFQDSDVYKWLEAAAYCLKRFPDKEVQKITDDLINLIGKAQESNGYLNTYFTIEAPTRKFKRLYQSHELYCAGHFIEAAVAYYEAVNNKHALNIACKLADHLCHTFGNAPNQIHDYDGHEEIEIGLLRLYKITKNKNYLNLAHFFLYERGKDPEFFHKQVSADPDKSVLIEGMDNFKASYYQNHKPILEQTTAEGHAVRVTYMCTAMAMLANEADDTAILEAAKKLWQNITQKRMYITGGIGSTVIGEAFTTDYDLPNDSMYCETCASIGLMFFAGNMLKNDINSHYGNIMEKALYNTVIGGMALDGKHFFYVNPLEVNPAICHTNPSKSHVKTTRPAWFGCACCPPNIARLIASLDSYIYTIKNNIIYCNLYLANCCTLSVNGKNIAFTEETNYPWDGNINFTINTARQFGLGLRIPDWCESFTLKLNDKNLLYNIKNGFIIIDRNWSVNDQIELILSMPVQIYTSHPSIIADSGKLAIQRGPLMYCLEGVDNGSNLHLLYLSKNAIFTEQQKNSALGNIITLETTAQKLCSDFNWHNHLYYNARHIKNKFIPQKIQLIPYYTWGNRGENEMRLWLNEYNS